MATPSAVPAPAAPIVAVRRVVLASALTLPLVVLCLVELGPTPSAAVASLFVAVLALLTVIDLEERRVPNRIVVPAFAAVLTAQLVRSPDRAGEWLLAALAAALFFAVPAWLAPGSIGMGDVKLALLLGAMLGQAVVVAIVVASVAAAAAALALLVVHGAAARRRTMPYVPFLALGAVVALFAADGLA
jgi:leader peptidase (prepilin peptidase) / N-methyltransferase